MEKIVSLMGYFGIVLLQDYYFQTGKKLQIMVITILNQVDDDDEELRPYH